MEKSLFADYDYGPDIQRAHNMQAWSVAHPYLPLVFILIFTVVMLTIPYFMFVRKTKETAQRKHPLRKFVICFYVLFALVVANLILHYFWHK
jgi:cytochrome c biogenesis factor